MKTNKSLLFLLASTLFILSSCTQARYGSMMRKAKPSKVENIASKKQKKDQVDAVIAQNDLTDELKIDDLISSDYQEEISTDIKPANATNSEVAQTIAEPKGGETQNLLKEVIQKIPVPVKKINKIKNKILDNYEGSKRADSDLKSILILILIIILVLAIVSLVLEELPAIISTVLFIILLVVLILWLMQFLN